MAKETRLLPVTINVDAKTNAWIRRGFMVLTILGTLVLIGIIFWIASHIVHALLLLIIAALFAYALAPAVKFFERFMPRTLAILVVYLVMLLIIAGFSYFAIITTIHQTKDIVGYLGNYLKPGNGGQPSQLEATLHRYGITHEQLMNGLQQIEAAATDFAKNSFEYIKSFLDIVIDTIIVAVLSIYLLIDGSHVARWIRRDTPIAARANFFLDTMQRVVGGYIRGQLTLATLIALLVWVGMQFIFRLPDAVFLGVLAFAMAFIPVLGTLISGLLCVVVGLTHSVLVAVLVLIYFAFIHVIESEVVGPRIVGKAIGLHPVISLLALIAGSELFGIWGALFASPVAGLLQAIIIAIWTEWRQSYPEQFRKNTGQLEAEAIFSTVATSTVPTDPDKTQTLEHNSSH